MMDYDYIFGQVSWLIDCFNGYCQCDVLIVGYGWQFFNGLVYSFCFEFGSGVCYDEYMDDIIEMQLLGYVFGSYVWQLIDNVKFIQGVLVFGVEDIILNLEIVFNVVINEYFGLKVGYNLMWNLQLFELVFEYIDCCIMVMLGYKM